MKLSTLVTTLICALAFSTSACVAKNKNYQTINWQEVRKADRAQTSSEWSTPVWLSDINTTGWEDGAFIFPDGQTLSFVYTNADLFASGMPQSGPKRPGADQCAHIPCGVLPRGDFYTAQNKQKNQWSQPKPHPLTLEWPIGGLHMNANAAYYMQDRHGEVDLYSVQKTTKGWSKPKKLDALNSLHNDEDPYVTPDNTQIFFWSDRPAAYKGNNIFYARKEQGVWQSPQLLPAPINSDANDMQPFVHGSDLYFMSTRGDGRARIFKTRLENGSWIPPEIVIQSQIGVGEPTLTADGQYLYFVQIYMKDGQFNPDILVSKRK